MPSPPRKRRAARPGGRVRENLEDETGSLENRPLNRKPSKIDRDELLAYCKKNPFATHVEAAIHFNCTEAAIRKAKRKLKITRKKRHPDT